MMNQVGSTVLNLIELKSFICIDPTRWIIQLFRVITVVEYASPISSRSNLL